MLIVDDFLMVPGLNMLFVFRQIHDPLETENASERSELQEEFTRLSSELKAGEITQAEFHTRGSELLRHLERIERLTAPVDTGISNEF